MSPETMDLREPTQIGLIVYDGTREDLYLKVDFQEANSRQVESLGWILAVPSTPEVAEASDQIFVDLMDLTRPYDEDDDPFEMSCMGVAAGADNGLGSVEILDKTVAGAFEITTVSSESAAPLRVWIESQEFHLSQEADPILDFYIEKNWRFLAVRIDLQYARENGALKPLKLSFATEKAVFPFRISAINGLGSEGTVDEYEDYYDYYDDYDDTEVLLYLVSDGPLTASNRSVGEEFSQAFTAEDLDGFEDLKSALPPKGHITKIRFWSSTEEMDDDIYFAPAAKAAGMVLSPGPRRGLHVYLMLALLGFAFIRSLRRGR